MNIAALVILAILIPIILALLIPIIAIAGGVTLLSRGAAKKALATQTAEEAALVRDIQAGLDRMAERVEALETLMVEENEARRTRPRV